MYISKRLLSNQPFLQPSKSENLHLKALAPELSSLSKAVLSDRTHLREFKSALRAASSTVWDKKTAFTRWRHTHIAECTARYVQTQNVWFRCTRKPFRKEPMLFQRKAHMFQTSERPKEASRALGVARGAQLPPEPLGPVSGLRVQCLQALQGKEIRITGSSVQDLEFRLLARDRSTSRFTKLKILETLRKDWLRTESRLLYDAP